MSSPLALLMLPLSFLLVGLYRYGAWRWHWIDEPNSRSSHQGVVPRGAGVVFALLITTAAMLITFSQPVSISFALALAVALIGWWDDLRSLPARYRFALYWLCTALLLLAIDSSLHTMALTRPIRFTVLLLSISLAQLWLINLYNFMDGINGIAGIETLFVLAAALWLGADSEFNMRLGPLVWIALFAVAGFLLWNFPIAKVFMGDAGSTYLGALIGIFMLWSTQLGGPSLYSWLILLGVFVVDTAYTLTVRLMTGQRWYLAHRAHAYQRLADLLRSHTRAVLAISTVNLLWLLPCAWLARDGGRLGLAVTIIAYAPLLAGCYRLKAGVPASATV